MSVVIKPSEIEQNSMRIIAEELAERERLKRLLG